MKKIVFLAFFGLLIQTAFSQVLEINSPSKDDLHCAFTWASSDNIDNLVIYVFGANGSGFVSDDKCFTWRKLVIDQERERDIFSALKVSENLIIVSGDENNDLLKYSSNDGETFYDLILPSSKEVLGISLFGKYVVFSHKNSLTYWDFITDTFYSISDYISDSYPEFYSLASDNFNIRLIGKKEDLTKKYFFLTNSVSSSFEGDWGVSPHFKDSITSFSINKGYSLLSFSGVNEGAYAYEGVYSPYNSQIEYNYFSDLKRGQHVKASFISLFRNNLWHVGGDLEGENGFIIKSGEIIKSLPDHALNSINNCGYTDPRGYCNLSDDIIIVGNEGRIFSNRLDLALAENSDLISDYTVSDTVIYAGDSATIFVSGSEKGVTYKVFEPDSNYPLFVFEGDGSPWSFSQFIICDTEFYILASKEDTEVILSDMAFVEVMIKTDYEISNTYADYENRVIVTISGSQKGLRYKLCSENGKNIGVKEKEGTGGPLSFELALSSLQTLFLSVSVSACSFPTFLDNKVVITINSFYQNDIGTIFTTVFPNPCKDILTIKSDKYEIVYLFDLTGKMIKSIALERGENQVTISDLYPGLYFLKTKENTIKIIKQ
jgi:hypothetical protein